MSNKTKRILTEKEQSFLDHLSNPENKGDIKRCMTLAGYSPNSSSTQIVSQLHEEIIEVASKLISSQAVKSVFALSDIIDSKGGGMGGSNIIKAASTLLDRAGLHKKEESVTLDVGKGIVILPAKSQETIPDEGSQDES